MEAKYEEISTSLRNMKIKTNSMAIHSYTNIYSKLINMYMENNYYMYKEEKVNLVDHGNINETV